MHSDVLIALPYLRICIVFLLNFAKRLETELIDDIDVLCYSERELLGLEK